MWDISFKNNSFFVEHIQVIMTLEESVQHVVMAAIQEVRKKRVTEKLELIPFSKKKKGLELPSVAVKIKQLIFLQKYL